MLCTKKMVQESESASKTPFIHEHGFCQEIAVQDKKGHLDVPHGTEAITKHLHHMGDRLIPELATDNSIPIMDLDGQRQTENLGDIPGQYTPTVSQRYPWIKGAMEALSDSCTIFIDAENISPARSTFHLIIDQDSLARYPF